MCATQYAVFHRAYISDLLNFINDNKIVLANGWKVVTHRLKRHELESIRKCGLQLGAAVTVGGTARDEVETIAREPLGAAHHLGDAAKALEAQEKAVKLMATGPWDKALLTELSDAMRDASICGLGQAAPNPLLSVLKYFPEELSKPLGSW